MATTTYGSLSQRTAAYAAKKMLEHAEPIIVLSKFGDGKEVPKNTAEAVKFRRPNVFAVATTPLTEGTAPTPGAITYTDVTATLAQYGAWQEMTDKVADLAEDPVLNDIVMLNGEQAAETMETLLYGIIKAGTSVEYNNGVARNAVNTAVTLNKLRKVVRTLQANRAKKITRILDGGVNIGTKPVEAAYIAFCHTDVVADLRGLTGFTSLAQYGSRQALCPQEVGSIEDIRIIASPLLVSFPDAGGAKGSMKSTSGTSADVYPIIIIGQNAYGSVVLKGKNAITPMILNPGEARWGDQLGQKGSAGWKTYWTAAILNNSWMVRLEVAVTDL